MKSKLSILFLLMLLLAGCAKTDKTSIRLLSKDDAGREIYSGECVEYSSSEICIRSGSSMKRFRADEIKELYIPNRDSFIRRGVGTAEIVSHSTLWNYFDLLFLIPLLVFIMYRQVQLYRSTKQKLEDYSQIFPVDVLNIYVQKDPDDGRVIGIGLSHEKSNKYFDTIKNSINRYLRNNRSTDFHIIKDIVDRNTDSIEAEISTQTPFPLYWGLMGTMSGVAIGLIALIATGGLSRLMDAASQTGAGGVTSLLFGVALAMVTSVLGVYLTTKSSNLLKMKSKSVEENKNSFLTWAQAELLPELSTGFTDELLLMTDRLTSFNQTFSNNSRYLATALSQIKEATQGQAQLMDAINNLRVTQLATANITVYEKLKDCSTEIGTLATELKNSAEYVEKVRLLNDTMNDVEARMKAMEEMAGYFKEERSQLPAIKAAMSQTTADVYESIKKSVDGLSTHTQEQIANMQQFAAKQDDNIKAFMLAESEAIKSRAAEISTLTAELKQMSAVKQSIQDLNKSISLQSRKMDDLMSAIRTLAATKSSGGSAAPMMMLPGWVKYAGFGLAGVVGITTITALVFMIIMLLR